jgi:hypothetical protein
MALVKPILMLAKRSWRAPRRGELRANGQKCKAANPVRLVLGTLLTIGLAGPWLDNVPVRAQPTASETVSVPGEPKGGHTVDFGKARPMPLPSASSNGGAALNEPSGTLEVPEGHNSGPAGMGDGKSHPKRIAPPEDRSR